MKKNAGFTLVELLVVVSILMISIGIAGDLILSVIRSYNKTKILNEIEQNGNYSISKISYDLRKATKLKAIDPSILGKWIELEMADGVVVRYEIVKDPASQFYVIERFVDGVGEFMTNNELQDGVSVDVTAQRPRFSKVSDNPLTVGIDITLTESPYARISYSTFATQNFKTTVVMLNATP